MKTREELIELYYKHSPRELADLIDLDYEKNRIETIPLDELEKEINFYREIGSWL